MIKIKVLQFLGEILNNGIFYAMIAIAVRVFV